MKMNEKLQRRLAFFIRALFPQIALILSIFLSLITIIVTILVVFFSSSNRANNTLIYWLPITFTTILVAITSYLLGSFREKRKAKDASIKFTETEIQPNHLDTIAYPPPLTEDFMIKRKEIVYQYLPDGNTMIQRKRLVIHSLVNGIESFKDRYRWTGKGKILIRSLTNGFIITNPSSDEEGFWNYFNVIFPHPLHKGDTADFTIEWELRDEMGLAKPFLSTMIDSETEYLVLEVILPDNLAPKRAYFFEYFNFLDPLPISTKEIFWSPATKSMRYEIAAPQKYHKYLIRWYSD